MQCCTRYCPYQRAEMLGYRFVGEGEPAYLVFYQLLMR